MRTPEEIRDATRKEILTPSLDMIQVMHLTASSEKQKDLLYALLIDAHECAVFTIRQMRREQKTRVTP